jgi:hypothetical protein
MVNQVVASTITYPSQVVRSRLQQVDPNLMASTAAASPGAVAGAAAPTRYYTGTLDVASKILRHEGVKGFYKVYIVIYFYKVRRCHPFSFKCA